ncbi:hypothetical protein MGN70_012795 [Eutypa lata]|uniref:Putative u2 snrnp component ist3 protein n=1 Tax=Eutypa lata (strain UCR-EL1) TaxID=1287681 RepID=M7SEQ9_EUTLA|nr:putative u2 snrnp component ist3 protein [Eutypa lata UCREL1]KAI1245901.1 hypothetical protein MGN70_012795 [Eutypa lata]
MNQIRAIQTLNKREIENGVPPEASWHTDYRDTAFVNFGGLPYELSEGDIITIFSQYGEPVFLKLARDKESGKSKGFGWLKYEDQRSTDLAVDNLGGAEISGRLVRVDHARYKPRDDEDPEEFKIGWEDIVRREKKAKGEDVEMEDETDKEEEKARRPMLKEERELAKLIEEHDEDDPMKGFLIEEKKQEVELALRKQEERGGKKDRKHKHRHRDDDRHHHRHRDHHHRSHRSRRDESGEESNSSDRHKRSRRDAAPVTGGRGDKDREETPERRRGDSRERERRLHDEGSDRHRDRERRSRRDDDQRRSSRRDVEDKDRDRDQGRRHRSRSRSKSPRSYRGR